MQIKVKTTELSGGVDYQQLHEELKTILPIQFIQGGSDLIVVHVATATSSEVTQIKDIVTSHVPIPKTIIEISGRDLAHAYDYHKERNELKEAIKNYDFSTLTDAEKEIVSKFCLMDDSTIVTYYMSTGLSMEDAQQKHLVRRSIDIGRAAESCNNRANSPVVRYITLKYMDQAEAVKFTDEIRNQINDYKTMAHLGTNYNNKNEGIMDFIESTGSFTSAGLLNYTMKPEVTHEQCREEFKNFLVFGIEPEEYQSYS